MCGFALADTHGGAQTVAVTTYGWLTASPSALVFTSPSGPAQSVTAHEDFYSGPISADLTTSDSNGNPGCASYATVDAASRNADSNWNTTFSISPQNVLRERCALTFRDDHGNVVQVMVQIADPMTTCPDGTIVKAGSSCPTRMAASDVTMTFALGCKQDKFGQWSAGTDNLQVRSATQQNYYIDVTQPEVFVAVTTITVESAKPVTFSASQPPGSTAVLALSTSGTQTYTSKNPFYGIGSWSGNVWTPPSLGTFYVGYVQSYEAADCNADAGGSGQEGSSTAYSGEFSLTATQ